MTFDGRVQNRIVVPLLSLVLAILMGSALTGCGEEQPVGLADRALGPAGKPVSGNPTVSSTNPSSAPVDTTLVVRILGSGYDSGSIAEFAIDSQPVPQVRTNSTTFVSSKELRANITIDADAPTELYDVIVQTSGGKRGIGIEKFEVFIAMTTVGQTNSGGWAVSSQGDVAGDIYDRHSSLRNRVFFWSEVGGLEEVGLGSVHDMSDDGRIIGMIHPDDTHAIVWTRLGPNSWTSEALPSPADSSAYALGINHAGNRIAGTVAAKPAVWDRTGGTWTLTMLPTVAGEPICSSTGDVNDQGMIAGLSAGAGTGCVWVEQAGAWTAHFLDPPANAPDGVSAIDINAFGDVLGIVEGYGSPGSSRAILWPRSGSGWSGPVELPLIPPGSRGVGLNDSGRIAGAYIRDGKWRAFLCCSSGFQDISSGAGGMANAIAGRFVAGSNGGRAVRWTVP